MNSKNMFNLALIFTLGGFLISTTTFSIYAAYNIIYTDWLHSNPNRTHTETLQTLCASPLVGVVLSLWNMSLAFLSGAIASILGYKTLGGLPVWYLFAVLPVCTLSLYFQRRYINAVFSDEIVGSDYWVWIAPHLSCYLLGCWWLSRKIIRQKQNH